MGASVGQPFQHQHGRGGPGGWWILPEVDVRLAPHDVVRPDLAGWRRERLPEPWGVRPIDVVPDWTCEVVSPSNARHDLVVKRALHARHGVAFYWIADPEARTLTALQLADGRWVELGVWDDTALVRVPPFEAVELDVGALFPPPPGAR
jgi:Uma2 family endonuclease